MSDRPDASLLEAWSAEGSEEAFAALARRYGGLLYHAAMRRTGRSDLAGEAAQNSLLILARKAPRLGHLPCLSGWLHRTACYEAAKLLRREQRHHARMKQLPLPDGDGAGDEASPWQDIAPVLDQALDAMPEKDREVIFLKFFDGLSFEQMARQFGGEPAAWRQRGSRALERLRLHFRKRGVAVSSAALSSGLGMSLGQSAPTAFLASLPNASAAVTALSWQTLTLHSLHLMKLKPAAAIAAVLLLSLLPLGMQARAISDARERVALLEKGFATSQTSSSRQALASSRANPSVNLVALADALLAAKEGDLVKRFTTEKKVAAMDVDELERLLTESTVTELGRAERLELVKALFRQFCRLAEKSGMPGERVVALTLRLAPSIQSGQGTLWNLAGNHVKRWAENDPDAAVAWYRQMEKPPAGVEYSTLVARAFDGLHRRSPDEAVAFFRSVTDQEKHAIIGGGGGADQPELMLDLASGIGDDFLRGICMNVLFQRADGRSPQEVRGWIDKLQPPANEAAQLLASAAAGSPGGEVSAEDAAKRMDWLRETAAGLDVSQATGVLLFNILHSKPDMVTELLDAEWERHPDERMLATYISRCMADERLILDAIPRSAKITDPQLRDSALVMMLLSTRGEPDARELARKGGLSEEEIDRLMSLNP
ncbi:sigma-70 family RNA polymerase sigma factor [Luteolibacter arcticus]|uniref:Sigma-70 family RNA polymerase sigma factor n=1 Tax=Luteolibacter arcticus TaxID=1581411 RepID=A0ABT3GSV1_9BACT|nr:sigma-70 family RNA polymerase sigma factor [Luteolibacter arcticus]MCW1926616.1 sigma-70 family RNA polymerase sigma factor [Luteolibacter arcticus]